MEPEHILVNGAPVEDTLSPIEEKLCSLLATTMTKNDEFTQIIKDAASELYPGAPDKEIHQALLNALRNRIELHPKYSQLCSLVSLLPLYHNILNASPNEENFQSSYRQRFSEYIYHGIQMGLLTPELKKINLDILADALIPARDEKFTYLGIQTLQDRYLLKTTGRKQVVFELPQWMFMRVAMGIALNESEPEARAIEFYNAISNFYLMPSTPTLFNSGTVHSQMSSCYLNTVDDSLEGIFKTFSDCAMLSKFAGGIGTDWTNVRSKNAPIKGTNGQSQGVIPFLKIFNDTALAVNQGGKRKGAMCAYLELWHADVEEFLEARKNTGDERRRLHDINTALWIPDLFMKRVRDGGNWTLFSPSDVKELHDLYGKDFEAGYEEYEKNSEIPKKQIPAKDLWRKMLTMLYETGHPWLTFKDAMNVRNPQSHAGVIHNSNLCTEIALNTSNGETAVCNLASIHLENMIEHGCLNEKRVERTVRTAVRMLDNVIDLNYYPIESARAANMNHRPVGLGIMGYHHALHKLGIAFDSEQNLNFADYSTELISWHAISASSDLAKERGTYSSYEGSKWSRGILPIDSLELLEQERGVKIPVPRTSILDWDSLRKKVVSQGMRNSNCMAIAPTATIANITGTSPCVEPVYKNLYMKENLSGSFVVLNPHLVKKLEEEQIWNRDILHQIKLSDGSIQNIEEIPDALKHEFKEAFEIDPKWIILAAARRSKWIDQAASTNIFLQTSNGKVLSDTYMLAWETGLKTTYYLRSMAASQITKTIHTDSVKVSTAPKACSILNPDCEACQ
jgi:ribonucleoside-diphosphate reductase alpha chain